jgi:hypothetical protein
MSGVPVEVSARRITVPYLCPCCCGVADTALAVSFTRITDEQPVHETTREIRFPYCSRCVRHSRSWSVARYATALVMACGVVAALAAAIAFDAVIGVGVATAASAITFTAGLALRARARAACAPPCTGPGPAVTYHGWAEQVQRFSFASRRYAAAFAEQNEQILINVKPHLYQLVEQQRVAAPAPAAAVTRLTTAPKRARATGRITPSGGPADPSTPRPVPMWPQRGNRQRVLLEDVMRNNGRTLRPGGFLKRPDSAS